MADAPTTKPKPRAQPRRRKSDRRDIARDRRAKTRGLGTFDRRKKKSAKVEIERRGGQDRRHDFRRQSSRRSSKDRRDK